MIIFLIVSITTALGMFGLGFYVGVKHQKSMWLTYTQIKELQHPSEMELANYFIERNGYKVVSDGSVNTSTFYKVEDKNGGKICRAVSELLASKLLWTLKEDVKNYHIKNGKIVKN